MKYNIESIKHKTKAQELWRMDRGLGTELKEDKELGNVKRYSIITHN
jgi:hypothetical protein